MPPPSDHPRPGLQPPRFRLKTLLAVIAICCILIAVIGSLSPYGIFAAVMFVLTVLAHFLGATIGHRLRDLGSLPAPGENPLPVAQRYRAVEPKEFAPTTRLSTRRRPGRFIVAMTVGWAILGGAGGAATLFIVNGERSNLINVSSGALAFAVLGGIWGFALGSFVQELFTAIFEAHKLK